MRPAYKTDCKSRREGRVEGQHPRLVSLRTCGRAVEESLRQSCPSKECVSPRSWSPLHVCHCRSRSWTACEKCGLEAVATVDIRMMQLNIGTVMPPVVDV